MGSVEQGFMLLKKIMLDDAECITESGYYFFFKDIESWSPIGPGARRGMFRILNFKT